MSVQDILQKSQITNTNKSPTQFALPDIPKPIQTYNPRTDMPNANYNNAEDQLVEVLGFLPINPKYMSNTTNSLAYNSMADVLFNRAAHEKRWGENSWLNTPLGYNFRVIADTALLLKDTIANPIVGSIQMALKDPNDDVGLFKGITAGLSTAVLNSLVNAGNTLDLVSNPLKGLFLDGPDGFVKGLVGDSNGRKQYDYVDYIQDPVAAMALEFVTDPLNLVSLGASGAAKTAGSTAAKAITSTLDDFLKPLAKAGASITDDLAVELVEKTSKQITKETAEKILKQVSDDAGKVTSEAVESYLKNVDDLTASVIKNTLRQAPGQNFDDTLKGTAKSLGLEGKGTRYKASLFKKSDYTPAVQKTVSELLDKADVSLLPNPSSLARVLGQTDRVANGIVNNLALWGTGLGEVMAVKKGVDWVGKRINNANVQRFINYLKQHPEEVSEMLSVLDNQYRIKFETLVEEADLKSIPGYKAITTDTYKQIDTSLNDALDDYTTVIMQAHTHKNAAAALQDAQQEVIEKFNKIISDNLSEHGIKTFEEYVEYVHMLSRSATSSNQLKLFDKKLIDLQNLLSEDLTDAAKLDLYIHGGRAADSWLTDITAKYNSNQPASIADAKAKLKEYRKQNKLAYQAAVKRETDIQKLDEAVNYIDSQEDVLINQLPKLINDIKQDDYVGLSKVFGVEDTETIKNNITLNDIYNDFLEARKNYNLLLEAEDADIISTKTKYVEAYNNLRKKLQQLTEFPKDVNVTTASEIRNAINESRLATHVLITNSVVYQMGDKEISESIGDYIRNLPEFNDVVEAMPKTVDLADYAKAQLVSYQMMQSQTRFALDLIEQVTQPNIIEEPINIITEIQRLRTEGFDDNNIAVYFKEHNIVLPDIQNETLNGQHIKNLYDEFTATVKETYKQLTDNTDETIIVADYMSDALTSVLSKYDTTQHIILENITTVSESPLMKALAQYEDTSSNLYKFLNDTTNVNLTAVQGVKTTLERIRSFQKIIARCNEFATAHGFNTVQQEGFIDQIISQINKGHGFKDYNLEEIANEMIDGMNIYCRTHLGIESFAADNLYLKTATDVFENSTDPAAVNLADKILQTLKTGQAHSAEIDNDNLWRYIQLDPELNKFVQISAGSRYKVIFDTETTGDVLDPKTKVFQLAAKVIDENGNEVKRLNYIINPGDAKPAPTVLKKVAQGDDPEAWWLNNIVNNEEALPDINSAMDAFYAELQTLDSSKGFIFIGQNIENFDLKLLKDHDNVDFRLLLEKSKELDTLSYLIRKNTPELIGTKKSLLIDDLALLLSDLKDKESAGLSRKLMSWVDMQEFSELKKIIHENYTGANANIKTKKKTTGDVVEELVNSEDTKVLEDAINFLNESWSNARNTIKGSLTYTVSKASIAEDAVKNIIDDFIAKGIINVPYGTNIMTFLNKYVPASKVFLNPKTSISYELENVFSLEKIKALLGTTEVSRKMATQLTHQSRKIMQIKSYLTDDIVDELYDDAIKFLQDMGPITDADGKVFVNNYSNFIYDSADDKALTVAAAVYYNRCQGDKAVDRFKDVVKYKRTPLLHTKTAEGIKPLSYTIEPHTGHPRAYYDDSVLYGYQTVTDAQKSNPCDAITAYNVERNIYNAHTAALDELHKRNSALAVRVESFLQKLGTAKRTQAEAIFRNYNTALSETAKNKILNRTNRVEALLAEAKLRMGRVAFTDSRDIPLSDLQDFIDAGILIHKTPIAGPKGTVEYVYKFGMSKEAFKNAEDVVLNVDMIKGVDGITDDMYNLIKEARQLDGAYVKNIGGSQGDVITKELIEDFDSDLPEDFVKQLPSVDELDAAKMFDSIRANHTFIWSTSLKETTSNYITSDPFKQVFYNTERFVKTHEGRLAAYINLLYNDANGIETSELFKGIDDADLVKMFKNSDIVVVYLQPGKSKWTRTGIGADIKDGDTVVGRASYQLKKIDIINEHSIKMARELNAHVIPRTQYLQMAHTINTFELPKIARFANTISTFYKLGYLSSIGFIVRNLIDSNFKNHIALEGKVSMPKQISDLFNTIKLLQRYNEIGQNYTKYVGHYFKTDLEYIIFSTLCENNNPDDVIKTIMKAYPSQSEKRITKYVDDMFKAFDGHEEVLKQMQDVLIDSKMFSLIDTFVQHGPSAGLSASVLKNIVVKRDAQGFDEACKKFANWITHDSPMRFVYDWNEMVEQSARLSLFLQRIQLGDSVDDAVRSVIKTHFDYSDKSLGMLYTEMILPFMSFSYKNLEFWIESVAQNPWLLRELENILRPCLNYQSLFNPDQEAYEDFDYTFDWSKDVMSFEARAPWQMINAARLFHLLQGNVVVDTGKTVKHDNGYGEKDNELYAVFKLSPSVLDAVKMLYNPLETYQQRFLPPYEVLSDTIIKILNGESPIEDISINGLLNNLPLIGAPIQRAGVGKHNNINKRIQDAGLPMAVSSLFTAAYQPIKKKYYWYDENGNRLNETPHTPYRKNAYYHRKGGFTPTYSIGRTYSSPYSSDKPEYHITKLARQTPYKDIYRKPATKTLKDTYLNFYKGYLDIDFMRKHLYEKYRYL